MFSIFTTSHITASHLVYHPAEPVVQLVGLWQNRLTGQMEAGYIICNLRLFHPLMATCSYLDEEMTTAITIHLQHEGVLDLVAFGGLTISHLFISLEPLSTYPNPLNLDEEKEYHIRGFILPRQQVPPPPGPCNPLCTQGLLHELALAYELYLHLLPRYKEPALSAYYAGLQNPVVMELARKQFDDLKI